MININKKISYISRLIKANATKILIYPSKASFGDGYDSYEKNYTYTNLNPLTIKGYVREISAESLVWKGYGLKATGAKELICNSRYKNWFKIANKIVIDDEEYEVMKEGVGGRVQIQTRPYCLIRVILERRS